MFSNFMSAPRALLAAVASSFPAQSIGPAGVSRETGNVSSVRGRLDIPVTTIIWPLCRSSKPCFPLPVRTCTATCATSCGKVRSASGWRGRAFRLLHRAPQAQTCDSLRWAVGARPPPWLEGRTEANSQRKTLHLSGSQQRARISIIQSAHNI